MSRQLTMVIALNLFACTANAQWMYPGGYGGYGMSRWGSDPAAGYMAGLGSFARAQGVYKLEKARADSINAETMIKWNKALRARQAALREERRKRAIKHEAELEARVKHTNLRDGTTLNPALTAIRDEPAAETTTATNPDRTGEGLRSAAKNAFRGMSWDQLEAHLRNR